MENHENYSGEMEALYADAREVVIECQKSSASFLQRKFNLGYAKAAMLIDMLEERGVIGPSKGPMPRDILQSRP